MKETKELRKYKKYSIYIMLIVIAILISLLNSLAPINKSSFIATDVAVWTNIAKRMTQGQVMYVDFFDHKGPVIYFIYYIGYLLGEKLGIWILDIISNIVNVLMIYKTSELLLNNKCKSLIVTIISMGYMSFLSMENPCTESIALPFMLIALYQFNKFIMRSSSFKVKESIITGMCFSIVLLLRPNLVAVWVVYYLYIFIKLLKEKEIKCLCKIIGFSIIGVVIIFLPIFLYLLINGAFTDFINTYLIFNLKYMGSKNLSMSEVTIFFLKNTIFMGPLIWVICLILTYINNKTSKTEQKIVLINFICFLFTFYLAIMPQRDYLHYMIPIMPTLVIPLIIILEHINKNITILLIGVSITYLGLIIFNGNNKIENYYKYDVFFDKLGNNIQKFSNQDDNVLILGNTTNAYLVSNRQYKGKYFYQYPIIKNNKKIADEVILEINNDLPEVIVNLLYIGETSDSFCSEIKKILEENYIKKDEIIYVKRGSGV